MGQGTESAGGYDAEYSWVHESELWGDRYKISDMTVFHLKNAIKSAKSQAQCASFSCDADAFMEWVDTLTEELNSRPVQAAFYNDPSKKKAVRGSAVELICHCGKDYEARTADLKRGYGLSCCKSCSATRRTFKKAPAKLKDGRSVKSFLKSL
jgi:hypothetical protein